MKKGIDEVIEELKMERIDKSNKEIISLKKEIKHLNNKIDYIDANIKTNYLTIIFGLIYYVMSNLFGFDKLLKISNSFSLILFLIIVSMFFYKENMILSKIVIKKLFIKK